MTGRIQNWTYDASGNITKRTEGSQEISYTYEETGWKDLLKSYNGTAIAYDDVGNPEDDGTWTYEWVHGRKLKKMTHKTTGETWDYTYNADGLRTKRTHTADGTTTTREYVYNGSQLTQMKKGSDTLHFTYDATGTPTTVTHKTATGETTYYYVTNLQGDVVKIIDSTGTTVATYTYDAWGNPTNTPTGTVATLNPLRYRSYVYDAETELYYLQSRYYNPEIGRFISADIFISTGQGFVGNNMFAYCGNNPVTHDDDGGKYWETAIDIISLCISVVDVACNPDDPMAWVGVAADIVFLAAPVVAGGGAIVKAATKADDVVDVVKAVDNVDEVADVGKAISKSTKSARATAVRKAWQNERMLVESTGVGTRNWTSAEITELLLKGKVEGYVGHHMKSVKGYPELAGDPLNIQFLTRKEHLLAHNGNWHNVTHGRYAP